MAGKNKHLFLALDFKDWLAWLSFHTSGCLVNSPSLSVFSWDHMTTHNVYIVVGMNYECQVDTIVSYPTEMLCIYEYHLSKGEDE